MAEALAIVGLVSAIVQFVDFGSKIIERLQDFHSSVNEVPKAFRDVKVELPLLLDTLKRTQAKAESGALSKETQEALLPVVEGCRSQVELLDSTLVKTLPKPGDSSLRRGIMAFSSMGQEKKVEQITLTLRKYIQTLTYHEATSVTRLVIRLPKPCFIMPFDRDQGFVGREDILQEIESRFKNQRRVSLAGIGGIGKSQIAIEYCYRWHNQHPQGHVIWIHASNQARLDQAYKGIARKLHLPGCYNPETDIFEIVFEWLCDEDHGPWLIVLDNADDIETFSSSMSNASLVKGRSPTPLVKFLPRSPNGSMIITTRDKRIGDRLANRAKTITVPPMTKQEADNLLQLTVSPQSGLDKVKSKELLEALGYLPLAITQAAAFINENAMTVAEYLEVFYSDSGLQELLSQDLGDSRRDLDIQNSIVRTWKLSFDQISHQRPRAAELLSLMSVLDRQGIPKTLLCKDDKQGIEFIIALGTLQAFSLISVEKGGTSYEMHRLVQLSTQNWLELQGTKARWQIKALELLAERFPSGEYETWNECEVLSPHAQVVVGYISMTSSHLLQYAKLLGNLAWYDNMQGRYNISYNRFIKLLNIHEAVLGKEHPDTLVSMNNLALVLNSQGKYDEAEAMHRQVLELRETVLGKEHPNTLTSMNNLALVLDNQGKYDEAEAMHRQVLELRETVLGKEHPYTIASMNNLALVLNSQGKYDKAEVIYHQVLEGYQTVLGKEHPDTLMSMNNLARVLDNQGKYDEAEAMHRQVLELRETVLGKEHPDTIASMNNLALVLNSQGKYDKAEVIYHQVLEGYQTVLGKEHPDTLMSMNNLARVLDNQGKYDEAEAMHRQVVELRETVLGKEHPNTLTSMNNLAGVLNSQGKYDEAEAMHQQVLELRETVLGKEHPNTLASMNNLAGVLDSQGKYDEAEAMHRRVLEGCQKVLGKEHPNTLTSMNNLAGGLDIQGKYDEAEAIYQQVLEGCQKVLGKEHPNTLTSMNNLAGGLDIQGKYDEAEAIYQQVLEGYQTVLGKEHPNTLTSMNNLAGVLNSQGKYDEAEAMHRQVLELRETVLGKEHPNTLTSMNNLALVLDNQGKYDEAEAMHRQVLELRETVLGKEHPDTLTSMNNLAGVLDNQGKYDEAEVMQRRVLEGYQTVLGKEHPNTLTSMNNLAGVLDNQGKYDEAEAIHQQVLNSQGKHFPSHPHHPPIL